DGGDLLGEGGLRGVGGGAALRFESELVLLLAADTVLAGDVLGRDTHVLSAERVGEHADGAVDEFAVAELVTVAGTEVVERHARHALVATGDGDLGGTPTDLLRRGPHGLQTRAAQAVDGQGRGGDGKSGGEGDATGVVGVGADLADAAHDDLVDVLTCDTRALQRLAYGGGAEFVRGYV